VAIQVGTEVIITGHPPRFSWMSELVGEKGKVLRVEDRSYQVEGFNDAFGRWALWFGAGYVKPLEEEAA
jgi:hypothetical protein